MDTPRWNDKTLAAMADGAGEERGLIMAMIKQMIDSDTALDGLHADEVAEHILHCIKMGHHRP